MIVIFDYRTYPCSLGRFSPTTLVAFFLTLVAPWEFSSSSTSMLKDMVSGEGRCLLSLKDHSSGKHQHRHAQMYKLLKKITKLDNTNWWTIWQKWEWDVACTCTRIRFGLVLIHQRVSRDELRQGVHVFTILFPKLFQVTDAFLLSAVTEFKIRRFADEREVHRRAGLNRGIYKWIIKRVTQRPQLSRLPNLS